MSDLKFKIKAHSENPTKTVVNARGFNLTIDEPASLGGTNEGANPVEYVLAAFSGCINVMGHLIAKEMGFELHGIGITLSGELNPERFMGKSFNNRAGYKSIEVLVNPDCDVSPETLNQWLNAIEERCPVSDNLSHETPINIKIEEKVLTSFQVETAY